MRTLKGGNAVGSCACVCVAVYVNAVATGGTRSAVVPSPVHPGHLPLPPVFRSPPRLRSSPGAVAPDSRHVIRLPPPPRPLPFFQRRCCAASLAHAALQLSADHTTNATDHETKKSTVSTAVSHFWAEPQRTMEAHLADPTHVVVLDGGLATELEARGCDLLDPLWSGKVLLEAKSRIQDVEQAYLEAGARCIITASYQVTPESLMQHRQLSEAAAVAAIEESVRIAHAAREQHVLKCPSAAPIFVAGSVGPYGAYLSDGSEYRGDYVRTPEQFKQFHRSRIAALLRVGVDVLAIETQPSAAEVRALVALLQDEHPECRAWVSFTTSRTAPAEAISDGTRWSEIVPLLDAAPQVIALGINCTPMAEATAVLAHLHTLTKKPLVVYTNASEEYDAVTKTWTPCEASGGAPLKLAHFAEEWAANGARLIGGCCRTGPADITGAASALSHAGYVV